MSQTEEAAARGVSHSLLPGPTFQEPGGTRIGNYADMADFESKILGNRRNITVYLPPSYASSPEKRYPVLYAHDGQNLFDTRTAFLNREWQLDETIERKIKDGTLPEIIVIGVWNTPARMEEYTPGSSGDRYLDFLIKELKPVIDRKFRTLKDRKHTAILGSSMGGLISTWAALRHPEVFGQSASLSADLLSRGEAIRQLLQAQPKRPVRMYLDFGTQEVGENSFKYLRALYELEPTLEKAGYRWGKDYLTYVDAGGQHNETSWALRVWRPLEFLFPR